MHRSLQLASLAGPAGILATGVHDTEKSFVQFTNQRRDSGDFVKGEPTGAGGSSIRVFGMGTGWVREGGNSDGGQNVENVAQPMESRRHTLVPARLVLLALVCLASAALGEPTTQPMVPFSPSFDPKSPPVHGLGFLNDPDSGDRMGRITANAEGRLIANGRRIRLFGANLTFGMPFPPPPHCETLPRELASLGMNVVRLHHLDNRRFPMGILKRGEPSSRQLDPEALARLDYFLVQLRRNGIYVNLNLLVSRPFTVADGLPEEFTKLHWKDQHAAAFFHPRLIELQKEYARALLEHRNAFTGVTYNDDPVIAFLEIINEHGLVHSWLDRKLAALPASMIEELRNLWTGWLAKRYAHVTALRIAWGDEAPPRLADAPLLGPDAIGLLQSPRRRDWLAFLHETEARYYADMAAFLKRDLGAKALIAGTASAWSAPSTMAMLDVVDMHKYHDHPEFTGRAYESTWHMTMQSLLAAAPAGRLPEGPFHFTHMSWFRVAGKPYSVSEYLHCSPNPYAGEGPLLLSAYASLQDWDALYLFAWQRPYDGPGPSKPTGHFMTSHPAIQGNIRAAALMFRRGDVAAASDLVTRDASPQRERDEIARHKTPFDQLQAGQLGVWRDEGLVHRIALRINRDAPPHTPATRPATAPAERWTSDTGELAWSQPSGQAALVSLSTARAKALVGFAEPRPCPLGNVTVTPAAGFATWSLVLLEGESFEGPCRALLTAYGAGRATDLRLTPVNASGSAANSRLTVAAPADWGRQPILLEAWRGTVELPGPAEAWTVRNLSDTGQRAGAPRPARALPNGRAAIDLSGSAAWYELTRAGPATREAQ